MSATSLSGLMPPGAEPVAHPHRVRARRERHREGQRRRRRSWPLSTNGLSAFGSAPTLPFHSVFERDRLAVAIEQPRNDHRLLRRAEQAHRRGDAACRSACASPGCRRCESLSRMAAQLAPFDDGRVDAVLLEEALLVRDDDGRAVGQRDHAEVHVGRLGRVGRAAGRGGPALRAERRPQRGGADSRDGAREKLAAVEGAGTQAQRRALTDAGDEVRSSCV